MQYQDGNGGASSGSGGLAAGQPAKTGRADVDDEYRQLVEANGDLAAQLFAERRRKHLISRGIFTCWFGAAIYQHGLRLILESRR